MKSRLVLSLALLANLATAQSPPTPAPAPAPEKTPVRERERTIYVPYDELEKVFNDGGKGVFLPYKEFLELWNELTLKRKEEEVKPPQDGVVSKAEYAGRVEGGTFEVGQEVVVFPSGMRSTIAGIDTLGQEHERATTSQSVVLRLTDDIDVSRGDLIADVEHAPR